MSSNTNRNENAGMKLAGVKCTKDNPTATVTLYEVNVYQLQKDIADLHVMRITATISESDEELAAYDRSIAILQEILTKNT